MFYIIYVSTASKPMSESDLEDVLRKSRKNNPAWGLTGLLIYRFSKAENMGCFIQVLEGEKTKVIEMYERIVGDKRHHSKIIIEQGESDSRQFPDWSMGFKNVDAQRLTEIPGFANIGQPEFDADFFKNSLRSARETLADFYDAD